VPKGKASELKGASSALKINTTPTKTSETTAGGEPKSSQVQASFVVQSNEKDKLQNQISSISSKSVLVPDSVSANASSAASPAQFHSFLKAPT